MDITVPMTTAFYLTRRNLFIAYRISEEGRLLSMAESDSAARTGPKVIFPVLQQLQDWCMGVKMPFPVFFLSRTNGISTTFPAKAGCITCPTVFLVAIRQVAFQLLFLFGCLHHVSYHISTTRKLTFLPLFLFG